MAIINEKIKEQRLKRGLTLAEVAESIGVKEATAQRYESGAIKNISHEVICKLAEVLHCTPSYLMGWEESPTPAASHDFSEEDYTIAKAYHNADEVDKEMVRRILKVEKKEDSGEVVSVG